MKKNTPLKILIILIIVAICCLSFIGFYVKNKNQMINKIPKFLFGMNLEGTRVVELKPDTSTKEVIYDSEGKIATDGTDEDGNLKEGYTKKDEPKNAPESLTEDNYTTLKKIIEKRLKALAVEEYSIRLDTTTGQMILELPDNTETDDIISNLTYLGKFEVQDATSNEVLLDNSHVKTAKALYGSTNSGTTVYLSIEFTKEGAQKLEEISKTYISSTDEEGNDTTKKIAIKIDDEALSNTYFGQTITNGILQLSIGSASSSEEELHSYTHQATELASLIDAGKTPVQYKLEDNRYFSTAISPMLLRVVLGIGIVILVATILYFIIRYKSAGVYSSISLVGMMALFSMLLRYTNVTISLEAIVAITTILVFNIGFLAHILKQMKQNKIEANIIIKQTYLRYVWIGMPLLIIAVVFAFAKWIPIASIGMVMFWGLFITIVYHYIVTRTLLQHTNQKIQE